MVKDKQVVTPIKTINFSLVKRLWSITIILLALIGDAVMIVGEISFYLLKGAFSILCLCLKYLAKLIFKFYKLIKTIAIDSGQILRPYVAIKSQQIVSCRFRFLNCFGQALINIANQKIYLPRVVLPKPGALILGFFMGCLFTSVFIFVPYHLHLLVKTLPHPNLLSQRVIPVTTQIFDRQGQLLYEVHGDQDRKPLPLTQIPLVVKQATVAIEDKNFYHHPGLSLTAIARAAHETLINNHLQGGSTITQQLIKNALLTPEISLVRKLKEVVLALWAEQIYTKDQILEMYLNQVPYGGTAWGIEAAAETYFNKKVGELDLAEAAFLAGLPAAPTYYSPYGSQPQLAQVRQKQVLRQMAEEGYITFAEEEAAKNTDLELHSPLSPIKAPHFVMYVRELLYKQYGARTVDQGGLRITTSLSLELQEQIQEIITSMVSELKPLKVGNGAAIVTNPKNGEILAMIGSKDYFNLAEDGNVNVVLSLRQPGSSIKAVTYAAALETGFTAGSVIEDTPVAFPIPGQPSFAPVNYDGRFHGLVTLRSALANSYNVPAVKVLNRVGLNKMIDMGRRLGITSWKDESRFGLSLTLGGGEVTLLDMAGVYGTLANRGKQVSLNPILKITDYAGKVYYQKGQPDGRSTLAEEIAFILSDILADNRSRTPAFGPSSDLVIPGKTVSVKTGTTNEKRDNWTIGYTPSFVVGVWVGNNDNSPMDPYLTSGVTGASPIWKQIMLKLLKDKPDEKHSPPANIIALPCYGRTEYFIKGAEPVGGCKPLPSPIPSPSL